MIQAPVGFHCPEDAKEGRQKVYTSQSLFSTNARTSPVTLVLIAINAAAFVFGLTQAGGSLTGSTNQVTIDYGLFAPIMDLNGEWYRLVTSGFLHAGLIHIGFNMWALYLIGPQLERTMGGIRFALAYFFCLLCGSLGALIASPQALTVGASGASFGLMGMLVIVQRANGLRLFDTGLGSILVLNLLLTFGFSGTISVGGHLGGLAGGLIAGWIFIELPRRSRALPSFLPTVAVVALGVAVVGASMWAAAQWMDPIF